MRNLSDNVIFNKVAVHLLAQKRRSTFTDSTGTGCMYRGSQGRSCAVGCLIPDSKYDKSIERATIKVAECGAYIGGMGNSQKLADILRGVTGRGIGELSILAHLQTLHDDFKPSEWPRKLRALAKQLNLKPSAKVKALIGMP